jgi:hypothetical protein
MKFYKDKDAQASAVALMLACLTFIIISGMIANSYVPIWMKENECWHMNEIRSSFEKLKTTIDLSISKNNTTRCSFPIRLDSSGIFLFTPGTQGKLAFDPFNPEINIHNSTKLLNFTATGSLKFSSRNRYYLRQEFIYELGSLIVAQSEGNFLALPPNYELKNISNNIEANLKLVSLVGVNNTKTGFGEVSIYTKLKFYATENYTWFRENLNFNITTEYSQAWYSYFEQILSSSGITKLPGSVNLTLPNFLAIRERLLDLQEDINANIGLEITQQVAEDINGAIEEIVDEVNDAIESVQENELSDAIESAQDAIEETYEAIEVIRDEQTAGEITDSYAEQLVDWLEEIIALLGGETQAYPGTGYRLLLYPKGVGLELSGVNKLTISYAVIGVIL